MKEPKISLTVGIDAKRAINNTTGLGSYSRYAIRALAMLSGANRYRLYAPHILSHHARIDDVAALPDVTLCEPDGFVGRHISGLWRSMSLSLQLQSDGVDIYHGLSNEIPLGLRKTSVASVVTVHDLLWRRFPRDYSAIDRRLYNFKYGNSIRTADRIIAISECTKRDIVCRYDIDPKRIDVIYQGIDPVFRPAPKEARDSVMARYGLHEPYIVAVGTVQSRKNQLLAVRALRLLPRDVTLAIVGRRTDYARDIDEYIRATGLGDRVRWIEDATLDDLPALYSAATVASYTSRYEGFGLPVVEAIACHTPVIAATGSCLEEAGGKGAIYVDPDDVDAFADAARRLIDDRFTRDKLVDNGLRHIRRFDMATFARQTVTAYQMAIITKFS